MTSTWRGGGQSQVEVYGQGRGNQAPCGRPHRKLKIESTEGPSIKYVTLFLANFDPLPLSQFVTHPGTPPKVRHTSWTPRFLVCLVQKTQTKTLCTNSLSIVRGVFSRGFSLEGFVRSDFCLFPFGQNTSVAIES